MKTSRWISVNDLLPKEKINKNTKDFEYVLCATTFGDVRPYKYGTPIGSKKAHFWNGNSIMDEFVTHWMPLPKMPERQAFLEIISRNQYGSFSTILQLD